MPHDTSRGTAPRPVRTARTGHAHGARTGPRPAARSGRAAAASRPPRHRDGRHGAPLRPGDPRDLGGYTLLGRLGESARGVVYLGRDDAGGLVAVRLLPGDAAAGREARDDFAREADAALQVTGRHTAPILAAGLAGDRPFVVSEFVAGPPLQRVVTDRGPLPPPRLRKLAMRTAAALAAIHRAGLVHGDFTPAGVLLGPDGAKVIGFGPARAAGPAGTAAYMAPEQIEEEPVGPAADVFAWGATMVFAATGRPPFGTGPSAAVMRRVTSRRPDLGDMADGPLRDLVARCLDKNPAARPTARQLVRALKEGRAPAPKPRPDRIPRYRWRMMVALGVVAAAGFVLGMLF